MSYRSLGPIAAVGGLVLCIGMGSIAVGATTGIQNAHDRHGCRHGSRYIHGKCRQVKMKRSSQTTGHRTENDGMTKAGEFKGDLRKLPTTPQPTVDMPPVREPGGEPKVLPTPKKTP
ncbi:MAG: hypothetical protein ACJ73D_02320 [Pyrinomonadaceae bacterium]